MRRLGARMGGGFALLLSAEGCQAAKPITDLCRPIAMNSRLARGLSWRATPDLSRHQRPMPGGGSRLSSPST
jgi:hypothetical protein